jgi:hypothetical protein
MATENQMTPEKSKNDQEIQKDDVSPQNLKNVKNIFKNSVGLLTIIMLWSIAGIIAFIISIYCFTKSGSTGEKVLGLLIALIMGPFYFIYAALNEKYCK